MTNWRSYGVDTVAVFVPPKRLRGLTRSVTVGPGPSVGVVGSTPSRSRQRYTGVNRSLSHKLRGLFFLSETTGIAVL